MSFKVLLIFLFFSFTVQASWYPPDYPSSTTCREQNGVKACLINHRSLKPYIEVTYSGYLQNKSGMVNVYIKTSKGDGYFPMQSAAHGYLLAKVNHFRNVHMCVKFFAYNGSYMPFCPDAKPGPITGSVVDWYADNSPENERHLFEGLAHEGSPTIEFAFFNELGEWDSLYGTNYMFSF